MANPADKVTFQPKPVEIGRSWGLVATHGLSGQQEHVIGFHTASEAKEWLASKGYKAWLKTRGYTSEAPKRPRDFSQAESKRKTRSP